ncbi:exonuclease SbcCD, D subunit [Peptostreptococcaceae bacterium AS15]|nr:exonuclease SbcCD, D subunit [Peptostreptococcaceae bacterium AS15]
MRILHTADWHIGKSLDGFSRIEEQTKFLDFFVEKAKKINPDLIIIAGDIFDTANPSALAETLFYNTLSNISENTSALTVIIAGNHDSPKRLASAKSLAKSHGIIIYESHDDEIEVGNYKNTRVISCNKGVIKVEINGKIANILALPYISENRLGESFADLSDTEEDMSKSFQEKFEALIYEKEKYFEKDEFNIMIAHLFAIKASVSDEKVGYSLGGAYIVDSSSFAKTADYIALGHVHKYQVIGGTQKRAYYSGSPLHYNKTEVKTEKKVILDVTIDDEKNIKVNEVEIPIFKKIEIWNATSIEDAVKMSEDKKDEESFVYLNIKTDRLISNEDIKLIKSNKKDIIQITPIMEIGTIQIVAENMLDKSDKEKFVEFFKEKYQTSPDENIINRYLDIVNFDIEDLE